MKREISKFIIVLFAFLFTANVLITFEMGSVKASDDGLVGYWSFDEGSGSTVNDGSSYGNDGTIFGAIWTNGKIGKALNFDGIDDYVEVPDDNSLDLTTMTLEAWIYLETEVGDTTNQNRIIEHREKQAKAYGLEIFAKNYAGCTGDQLVMHTTLNYNIRNTIAPTHINTYQWYHVVGTYDGEYQKLYINGVLDKIGTKISGITSDISGPVLFGTESKENCFFDGIIDEVRIYNRALSADEIYQHYLGNFGKIEKNNISSGDSTNGTPGFTTVAAIAACGIGALVAFFRRRH